MKKPLQLGIMQARFDAPPKYQLLVRRMAYDMCGGEDRRWLTFESAPGTGRLMEVKVWVPEKDFEALAAFCAGLRGQPPPAPRMPGKVGFDS